MNETPTLNNPHHSRIWIKRALLLLLAIIFGISSALLANHALEEKIQAIEKNKLPEQKRASIIVAKHQIMPGTRLDKTNLAIQDIPTQWIPSYAITAEHLPKIENQISAYTFSPGDIVIPLLVDTQSTTEENSKIQPPSHSHSKEKKHTSTKKIMVVYGNQTNDDHLSTSME